MSDMHTYHVATDRRCYNGACCSDLQREIDSIAALTAEASKRGGHTCYFPTEEKWSVWTSDNKQVSGMYSHEGDALVEFLDKKDGVC